MADPTMQAVLARLETLQTKVEAQDAKLARYARHRRGSRRLLPLLAVALLVTLAPFSVLAASPFTDLTSGVHDANIEAIYTAGVTKGCVPNEQYCPTANVTREEMASFLARLGGLGSNPPVANALTAVNATNAQNATNATNATTVGGYAPGGLVRVARSSPSTNSIPLTRNNLPVFTVTLTPPGPGFVLVTATVLLSMDPPPSIGSTTVRSVSRTPAGAARRPIPRRPSSRSECTRITPGSRRPQSVGSSPSMARGRVLSSCSPGSSSIPTVSITRASGSWAPPAMAAAPPPSSCPSTAPEHPQPRSCPAGAGPMLLPPLLR